MEQGPSGGQEPGPVNDAAYNMDLNQRNADFVIFPTIRIPNLHLEAGQETLLRTDVSIRVTIPKGLNYIDDSCFENGQYEIKKTINEAGETVLELVIHDVEIDWSKEGYSQGNAYLPPIHYSCTIGAPGTAEDVKNNQQFLTTATIHTTQDHRKEVTENGNIDSCSIKVSRQ